MGTLSKLRRMVLRENVSVREAAKRLRISRNTAAKWLNQPRYPQRAPAPSLLDPYREQLANWLKTDSYRGKRERRSVRAYFVAPDLFNFSRRLVGYLEWLRRGWRSHAASGASWATHRLPRTGANKGLARRPPPSLQSSAVAI